MSKTIQCIIVDDEPVASSVFVEDQAGQPRRVSAHLTLVDRGYKGIVIAGLNRPPSEQRNLNVVEVYDPVTNKWCTGPSKPSATSEARFTFTATTESIAVLPRRW